MKNHRVLFSAVIVTALVGLACAGGDTAGTPGTGSGKESKADTSKLKVGASSIQRKDKREAGPSAESVQRSRRKDLYLVKLEKGGDLEVNGKTIGRVGASEGRRVHRDEPKNKQASESLGLGRTLRIRTSKPYDEVVAKLEADPDVLWVEAVTEVRHDGPRGDGEGKAGKQGKGGGGGGGGAESEGKAGKHGGGGDGDGKAGKHGGGARASGAAPNDPYYSYQWHLQNLNVPQAWQVTMGEGVVVAVVDTGVSENEDGFFKLLRGRDFVDNDNDPTDLNGHGSHVAGTIAQASNNGKGVAGVAPKVAILPVRVLDANGSGDNNGVAEGIIWAVDNGANIINLSLGSHEESETVSDAVAYAYENNVTVVAATGNDGFTDFIGFPAALPTAIAVGSVDVKNHVAFYSNQGKQIDIVAPGGDTTVDLNGDGLQDGVLQETRLDGVWSYHFLQGTSMATPHVAGVAALVYANGVRDPDKILHVLTRSAEDLGDRGWDSTFGHGLVNPVAALKESPRGAGEGGGGGGDLVISKARGRATSQSRGVISWTTNEPSNSVVRGPGGFERKDDSMSRTHQVSVTGKPGQKLEFQIASSSRDGKARDTVTVQF